MLRYALPLLGLLMLPPFPSQATQTNEAPDTLATAAGEDQPDGAAGAKTPAPGSGTSETAGKSNAKLKDKAAIKADGVAAQKVTEAPGAQPMATAVDAKAATDVAIAYLNALKEKGFVVAPAYLHADAMARFKTLVMPGLKDEQARGARTLLNATFGRDASYAAAAGADPQDFLARFARLISAREPDAAPHFSSLTPIGVVREGEQLHVLVRLNQGSSGGSAGPQVVERIEVVSLLPQGKEWKVMLDGRLQDLGRTLARRTRTDDRRGAPARMEPLPEGVSASPVQLQGPAGLPPLPDLQR